MDSFFMGFNFFFSNQFEFKMEFTLSSSSISDILRSIARFSRFSNSDNVFFVVCWNFDQKRDKLQNKDYIL